MQPRARWPHAVVALLAGVGVLLTCVLTAAGAYDARPVTPGGPHLYGPGNAAGTAGAMGRLIDSLSYFTEWSNIAVAAAYGLVAWGGRRLTSTEPRASRAGTAPLPRGARVGMLTALLMITVTAVVYAVLLAPGETVTGWSRLTNPWQHIVVPALSVLVWIVWGPRLRVSMHLVGAALVVPIGWLAYALIRGAVIDAYPYGFLDPLTHGYPAVLLTVVAILAFALVVAAVLAVIDRVLQRRAATGAPVTAGTRRGDGS